MAKNRSKIDLKEAGGVDGSHYPSNPCNSSALRRAMRHVSALYDEILAPVGLRATQRSVLFAIARDGNPTVIRLADSLGLDRTTLTRNLDPLRRQGLVLIESSKLDKRERRIRLTKKGEEKLQQAVRLWAMAQEIFEEAYGKEEAGALRRSLDIVARLDFRSIK